MTKDEGGRYTPFMENYRPQLFLRTADITVAVSFPEGTPDASEKMVCAEVHGPCVYVLIAITLQIMPGDNVELVLSLVHDVAADVGIRYACLMTFRFLRVLISFPFQFHAP